MAPWRQGLALEAPRPDRSTSEEIMAAINWIFFCEYAFVTNNKPSMIGIFSSTFVRQVPTTHSPFYVIMSLSLTQADGNLVIGTRIIAPTGKSAVASSEYSPTNANSGGALQHFIFPFYSMSLPEAGEYRVEIFANRRLVRVLPLPIYLTG